MTTINRIKRIVNKLECPERLRRLNLDRQERLKVMVIRYGMVHVALAAGYAESTLQQYIRVTIPSTIGEDSVRRAEEVLKQL